MPKLKSRKGFTLIELMVAVTIVAVLASIGLVTYSKSQVIARDNRRKQDLQNIRAALELYYQANKRYPCTGDNTWVNSSSSGGYWITDTDYANCSDTTRKDLDKTYIGSMPIDPTESSGTNYIWNSSTNNFHYSYRGYYSAFCPSLKGQVYFLAAELENTSDPDRNAVRRIADCNGNPIVGSAGWDNAYVISSQQ